MLIHVDITNQDLHNKIRKKEILFAGNVRLKIYGQLNCRSGKRMKNQNRVFFISEQEALAHGYRPCGHCMLSMYLRWKNGLI